MLLPFCLLLYYCTTAAPVSHSLLPDQRYRYAYGGPIPFRALNIELVLTGIDKGESLPDVVQPDVRFFIPVDLIRLISQHFQPLRGNPGAIVTDLTIISPSIV